MDPSKPFNTDRLFGIAAFLISIGTFFIYIYEARLLQKQQYASVLPYLELWNSGGSADYKLILVNNGVGPAFIQQVRVHYQGKVYEMDHSRFYETVIFPQDTIRFGHSNIGVGRVIPAGQQLELIYVTSSEKDRDKLRKLFGEEKAQLEITYASVYEERWQLKGMQDPPRKIED